MRLIITLFLFFSLLDAAYPRERTIVKSPDFNENWWNSISFISSWTELFTIHSTLLTWRQGGGCHVLLCSNINDCNFVSSSLCANVPTGLFINAANFNSFRNDPGDYSEFADKKNSNVLTDSGENERNIFSIYLDFKFNSPDSKVDILNYIFRNEKKLIVSPWLKSLKCKSNNFLKIFQNKNIAKTVIAGKFALKDNVLFFVLNPQLN